MKIFLFSICLLCFFIPSRSQGNNSFTIINYLAHERKDQLIVLSKTFLEKKLRSFVNDKFVIINNKNIPVPVQYDDLNGDGHWDEAAFLFSFAAGEKIVFVLSVSDNPATIKAVVRAHVRQKRKNTDNTFGNDLLTDSIPAGQPATNFSKEKLPPFLTEGPAWENDKVGFRIYFDMRNGKDLWGKTTSAMVMDETGTDPSVSYHKQAAWGMDILKVGNSLGAGSLALRVPVAGRNDTLVRLGGVNMGKVIYQKIADGPVRAIFRLHYPEWKILDNIASVDITEEITIWGGHYFYESKVTVKNAPLHSKLVTGIVNYLSKKSETLQVGTQKILYSYDVQSENHDYLGMAISVPKKHFNAFGKTANTNTDVQNTSIVSLNIENNKPVVFRFYACWEKSDTRFINEQGFAQYLRDDVEKNTIYFK